jgi:hypothetical protein
MWRTESREFRGNVALIVRGVEFLANPRRFGAWKAGSRTRALPMAPPRSTWGAPSGARAAQPTIWEGRWSAKLHAASGTASGTPQSPGDFVTRTDESTAAGV